MACGASCWRWEVARQLSRVQWTTAITQNPGTRLEEAQSGGWVRTRQGISRRLAAHDSPLEMELLVGLVVSVTQRGAASLQSEWMYLDVYHTARRETSHGAPRETLHHTIPTFSRAKHTALVDFGFPAQRYTKISGACSGLDGSTTWGKNTSSFHTLSPRTLRCRCVPVEVEPTDSRTDRERKRPGWNCQASPHTLGELRGLRAWAHSADVPCSIASAGQYPWPPDMPASSASSVTQHMNKATFNARGVAYAHRERQTHTYRRLKHLAR